NTCYKLEEQKIALKAIVTRELLLVVVLPIGGGKSLLFLAPTYLKDLGLLLL
ncbi:hypothetical protein GQ44DRAFT_633580, partial [Phaeosphaeriaceae sp. PMI808]